MTESLHLLTNTLLDVTVGFTSLYFFFAPIFWLVFVLNHYRASLREYRNIKHSFGLDRLVHSKIVHNYKTVLFKDLALIILLVLEWLLHVYIVIIFSTNHIYRNHRQGQVDEIALAFNKCSDPRETLFFIGISYTKPVVFLYLIVLLIVFLTFIQLFSFLCTYLKRRYNGYNIDKRVVSKHAAWWCIQAVLLFLCAIPYTQILLTVMCPLLLFINWIVLVGESRSLSRAIQSVLYEIKHFECDDVRYKASYASYKTYKVFIRFQLTGILLLIILAINECAFYLLYLLLVDHCYLELLYKYKFDFLPKHVNTQKLISSIIINFNNYATFLLFVAYSAVVILPRLAFLSKWGLHLLVRRLTYKKNPIRFNQAILRPLLPREEVID